MISTTTITIDDSEDLIVDNGRTPTPAKTLKKNSDNGIANDATNIDEALHLFLMCAYSALGHDDSSSSFSPPSSRRRRVKLNVTRKTTKNKIAPKRRKRRNDGETSSEDINFQDDSSDGEEEEESDDDDDDDENSSSSGDEDESFAASREQRESLNRLSAWIEEQMEEMREVVQAKLINADALGTASAASTSRKKNNEKQQQDDRTSDEQKASSSQPTAHGLWSLKIEPVLESVSESVMANLSSPPAKTSKNNKNKVNNTSPLATAVIPKSVEELTRIAGDNNTVNTDVTRSTRQEEFQAWIDAFGNWLCQKVELNDDGTDQKSNKAKTKNTDKKNGNKNTSSSSSMFETRAQILMLVMCQVPFDEVKSASLQECVDALVGTLFCCCDEEEQKKLKESGNNGATTLLKVLLPEPEVFELSDDD